MTNLTTPAADRIDRIADDLQNALTTARTARDTARTIERAGIPADDNHAAKRRRDEQSAALEYLLKAAGKYTDSASRDLFNLTAPTS